MPLSAGHQPGPYEILDQLGEGGMVEIYNAPDPAQPGSRPQNLQPGICRKV